MMYKPTKTLVGRINVWWLQNFVPCFWVDSLIATICDNRIIFENYL